MLRPSFILGTLMIEVGLIAFVSLSALRQLYENRIKDARFTENVNGRRLVAVVTGGDMGSGPVLVRELVAHHVKVYIFSSSYKNGSQAAFDIAYDNGFDYDMISTIRCDFADFQSIRKCVSAFNRREPKLDILINLHTVRQMEYEKTIDGHELHWQSNYLSPFLLTQLLLPSLQKSNVGGRIVSLSDECHKYADTVDAGVVSAKTGYNSTMAYCRAALARVMHAAALTKKISPDKITINAYPLSTYNMFDEITFPYFERTIKSVLAWFVDVKHDLNEEYAQTGLHLALSPAVKDLSGKYFRQSQMVEAHPLAYDEKACDKLYKESRLACGL